MSTMRKRQTEAAIQADLRTRFTFIQSHFRLLTTAACGQVLDKSRHGGGVGRRSRLEAWTACLGKMPPLSKPIRYRHDAIALRFDGESTVLWKEYRSVRCVWKSRRVHTDGEANATDANTQRMGPTAGYSMSASWRE